MRAIRALTSPFISALPLVNGALQLARAHREETQCRLRLVLCVIWHCVVGNATSARRIGVYGLPVLLYPPAQIEKRRIFGANLIKPATWQELLTGPDKTDHIVQVYQDTAFLVDAVAAYIRPCLEQGEAAVIIARPEHAVLFKRELRRLGLDVESLIEKEQLKLLDAAETLRMFMKDGMPDWRAFQKLIGGVIAELRLGHPAVRAYGEMVDILWHEGKRDAAIKLEEFWNELIALQTFSLFCAYRMDNTAADAYGGPLQCVCKVHSHLIPARDYDAFNKAVIQASEEVLGRPLAKVLRTASAKATAPAVMPEGQAALFWLGDNMPLTAEKVLDKLRAG